MSILGNLEAALVASSKATDEVHAAIAAFKTLIGASAAKPAAPVAVKVAKPRRSRKPRAKNGEVASKVLDALRAAGAPLGAADIATKTALDVTAVRQVLQRLTKQGDLQRSARGAYQSITNGTALA